VGPAAHLRELEIPVVADRPSIGAGLHDHPNVPVFFKADREVDCRFPQLYSFYRTNPETALPLGQSDTCYVFWPAPSAMRQMTQRMLPPMVVPEPLYGPRSRAFVRSLIALAFKIPAVQRFTDRLFGIILILGKPKSRGTLRLLARDAATQAKIDPAYYADPEDLATMVRGVRLARQMGGSAGLKEWGARELRPGRRTRSDAAIARYVRKNTITTYHFAGTCGLGPREEDAVDTQLRVRGVQGVRIADASAIPVTPVSALNAPSMLIGYRCAKMIRGASA
jgi:choline dehydrogenase